MIKTKLYPFLPYIGIPVVITALLLIMAGKTDSFSILLSLLLAVFGYIAAVVDIKDKKIPNDLVLAMIAAWILLMIPKLFLDPEITLKILVDSAAGFAIGGGLFLLVYFVSRKGLGGGDVKLMAAVGMYMGLYRVLPAMLYGTVIAALVGAVLLLLKKIGRKDTIPLAPFLYAGILITIFLA